MQSLSAKGCESHALIHLVNADREDSPAPIGGHAVFCLVHRSYVVDNRLVNYIGNFGSVTLSEQGVGACARRMVMGPIAPLAQQVRQRAVRGTCYSPRLLDWHAGITTSRRNETVHASVKVCKDKAVLGQELDNAVVLPISAPAWPLH